MPELFVRPVPHSVCVCGKGWRDQSPDLGGLFHAAGNLDHAQDVLALEFFRADAITDGRTGS